MRRIPRKLLTSLCISLGLLAACQTSTTPLGPSKINPKALAAAQALIQGASTSARTDAQGRLQVYVYVSEFTSSTLGSLNQAGLADIQSSPEMGLVQGWIAPSDLNALAALDCVKAITLPRYASPH